MDIRLRQRGRASIEYAADLGRVTARLSQATRDQIAERVPELAEDLDDRLEQVEEALADFPVFKSYRQLGEWMADSHGRITIDAFEQIRDEIEPEMAELQQGKTTLEKNPDCHVPAYWPDVEIHRTTGGQVLMTDIRPYRDRDELDIWQQEFNAVNGGEPYWREAALLNLADLATEHGFVDAKSYGLGEMHYPWVTLATKPEN